MDVFAETANQQIGKDIKCGVTDGTGSLLGNGRRPGFRFGFRTSFASLRGPGPMPFPAAGDLPNFSELRFYRRQRCNLEQG